MSHVHRVYLSDKELAARYGTSRATIWRWVPKRGFPTPIRLSPGCTRWKLSDVEDWEGRLNQPTSDNADTGRRGRRGMRSAPKTEGER
jgi:predicted DNA-binding transcriptional regulator AlpA